MEHSETERRSLLQLAGLAAGYVAGGGWAREDDLVFGAVYLLVPCSASWRP